MRRLMVSISFVCLCLGALPAIAQTTPTTPAAPTASAPQAKVKPTKPPKQQKSLFDQKVLYPDDGRLSAEGVPEVHIDTDGVTVTVRGFRSSNILYFQVAVNNQSKADFPWVASSYHLATDKGAALAQYSTVEVAKMLNTHATTPAPLASSPSTASTYGNGFPNNGYPSGAYPGNSTNGYATPQKTTEQSVVLDGLFAYGRDRKRRQREIEFAKELTKGSAIAAVVGPGVTQRFYLTFVLDKSNYYTLTPPTIAPTATTMTSFKFYNDKPKNWQPVAE